MLIWIQLYCIFDFINVNHYLSQWIPLQSHSHFAFVTSRNHKKMTLLVSLVPKKLNSCKAIQIIPEITNLFDQEESPTPG